LLEHADFVHSVARGLLGPTDAEDVAQDTWIRAARFDLSTLKDPKSWLATLTLNRARDVKRGERRREKRERSVARPEAVESVDRTYAKLEAQREVVAKILALDEPYKSIVILRYYHELTHEQIAARLGSKASTVRTQLVRAHEQLRTKLDREYGDRSAWAGLLVPTLARTTRNSALGVAVAAAIVALGVGAYWLTRSAPRPTSVAVVNEARPSREPVAESRALAPTPTLDAPQERAAVATSSAFEPADEELCEPAELFDGGRFYDYEKKTFNFEYGLRDDPLHVAGNRCDIHFESGDLYVTDAEHASWLVDLGARSLDSLASEDLDVLVQAATDAVKQRAADPRRMAAHGAAAVAGHTYFVWRRDLASDVASAFEVMEFVEGSHCMLDWYSTTDGRTAKGSIRDSSTGRSLMYTLAEMRRAMRSALELARPHAVLQLRTQGGANGCKLALNGSNERFYDFRNTPLDLDSPLQGREPAVGYIEGGHAPSDGVFVVTRARYRGRTPRGKKSALRVDLAGRTLFDGDTDGEWIEREWTGRVEIRPGEEGRTFLQIDRDSSAELVLDGSFERTGPTTPQPPATREQVAAPTPRVSRKSAGPRFIETTAPRIELSSESSWSYVGRDLRISWADGRLLAPSNRNDLSVWIDLGDRALDALELPPAGTALGDALRTAAETELSRVARTASACSIPLRSGHVLLLAQTNAMTGTRGALLRVVESDPERGCVLDHYAPLSEIGAVGSLHRDAHPRGLDQVILQMVRAVTTSLTLVEPRFEIQTRPEGSPNVIAHLNTRMTTPEEHLSREPLDLEAPESRGPSQLFVPAPLIPRGQQLVITRIEYGALPLAKPSVISPHIMIQAPGATVVNENVDPGSPTREWVGEFVLRPGDEQQLAMHASKVRSAWARFEGRFEPLDRR